MDYCNLDFPACQPKHALPDAPRFNFTSNLRIILYATMIPFELVPIGVCEVASFAGLIHSNPGTSAPNSVTDALLATFFGAGCGLIAGMILSKSLRYFAMVRGQRLGHYRWTVISATLLGALVFGTYELME